MPGYLSGSLVMMSAVCVLFPLSRYGISASASKSISKFVVLA